MKKTMVRIVAALLVAMLALTLLPMGAFAIEADLREGFYEKNNPTYADSYYDVPGSAPTTVPEGTTLKVDKYDALIEINGELYDFKGFATAEPLNKLVDKWIDAHPTAGIDEINAAYNNFAKALKVNFKLADLKIPMFPTDIDDQIDWMQKYRSILAGYTPHQHALSRWYSDGTTHWKECLTCKKYHVDGRDKFMYQNWCQDGDEDGICNICGGDVPYHDVTVVEEEGGKIIVNRDNACHRMKITADVEPAEGYKLKKLHFTKIRDDGSEQEITRYKKNGQFWTYMPTYELEVSAEFVKVKTKK